MDSNKATYTHRDLTNGETSGTDGENSRHGTNDSPKSPLLLPEDDIYDKEKGEEVSASLESSVYLDDATAVQGRFCPSCLRRFVATYRSSNPQSRVTPFAVVLLLVLLLIYVLNQADRLVLAVLIPAGLRCSGSNSSEDATCQATEDNNSSTASMANYTDCIEFDDNEQGLLTGDMEISLLYEPLSFHIILVLLGPAFTVIYVLAGLPLAYLADTRSRSLVLLIGIAFWSVIVLLTGFVQQFWELLLLRIFLGIGEVRMGGAPCEKL